MDFGFSEDFAAYCGQEVLGCYQLMRIFVLFSRFTFNSCLLNPLGLS